MAFIKIVDTVTTEIITSLNKPISNGDKAGKTLREILLDIPSKRGPTKKVFHS